MFEEVVCPRADVNRKWYTLPLSFLMHSAFVALLIVIPLVVTDALPAPRTLLNFIIADVPPVPVAPSTAPRRIQTDTPSSNDDAAPVEAPIGVHRESALLIPDEPIPGGLEGVVGGLGVPSITADAPPPIRDPVMEPVRLSAGVKLPTRIKDVSPVYPEIARKARVQGVVILEAIIGVDGKVQQARVLRSVPLLDQAALNAVQSWEYTPTLLSGRPVPIIMTVTVQFRLE
jgi:periplasmic protein TonB